MTNKQDSYVDNILFVLIELSEPDPFQDSFTETDATDDELLSSTDLEQTQNSHKCQVECQKAWQWTVPLLICVIIYGTQASCPQSTACYTVSLGEGIAGTDETVACVQ